MDTTSPSPNGTDSPATGEPGAPVSLEHLTEQISSADPADAAEPAAELAQRLAAELDALISDPQQLQVPLDETQGG